MSNGYYALRDRLTPGLRFNQLCYEDVLSKAIPHNGVWVDAGCGWQVLQGNRLPIEQAMISRAKMVIGCDPDEAAIRKHRSIKHRVVCTMDALPFKSGTVDLLTANMVMEHVEHPTDIFTEVARTLKAKGCFLIHTPFKWGYFAIMARCVPHWLTQWIRPDSRSAEDYYPVLYRCNTPSMQRLLAAQAGLTVSSLSLLASDAVTWHMANLLTVLELLLIRLSLSHRFRYLRVTLCSEFTKPLH